LASISNQIDTYLTTLQNHTYLPTLENWWKFLEKVLNLEEKRKRNKKKENFLIWLFSFGGCLIKED